MLYFLVTSRHRYTIDWFLADWGKALVDHVTVVPYDEFVRRRRLPSGSYIFTDIERIPPVGLETLQKRWLALVSSGKCLSVLNQPKKVRKRLELLNVLSEAGINTFNAYPVRKGARVFPNTFPVFVREANDHMGPYGGLVHSQTELDSLIERLGRAGKLRGTPIVTEFIDTSDDAGLYRKYAAFRLGSRIVPTHVYVNTKWFVKASNSNLDQSLVNQEQAYIHDNPHEDELRKIFDLANIDYGRVDYSLLDGRVQVFEINTNPVVMLEGMPDNPERVGRKRYVAKNLVEAFLDLDKPKVKEP